MDECVYQKNTTLRQLIFNKKKKISKHFLLRSRMGKRFISDECFWLQTTCAPGQSLLSRDDHKV